MCISYLFLCMFWPFRLLRKWGHILTQTVCGNVSWRIVPTAVVDRNWFSKLTSRPNTKADSVLVHVSLIFQFCLWIEWRPSVEISRKQTSFRSNFIFHRKFLIFGCPHQTDKNVPVPWEEAAWGLLRRQWPARLFCGEAFLVYWAYNFHSSEKFMSDGKL